MQALKFKTLGEELTLLPSRAIWWERKQIVMLADWHIGKVGHFRKEGIPIPSKIHIIEFDKIEKIINEYPLKKLLILGDLFHSLPNNETRSFNNWADNQRFEIELIVGNHDDYSLKEISDKIKCYSKYIDAPFIFTHEPLEDSAIKDGLYGMSGHIHPSIRLNGKGKQSLKLPCFYFGKKKGILPAFGSFTGGFLMKKENGSIAFPITSKKVFPAIKND